VGSTTYGKGIVQTIVPIDDGSAVKLTTCAYYTPSGVCIHGTGIEPDVAVDFNSDEYYNEGKDNQLDAAVEEMHKLWEETK
jgi:carboxyl-terminal processing protease